MSWIKTLWYKWRARKIPMTDLREVAIREQWHKP